MATLKFEIPAQEFEFDIEDEDQIEMFRQALIDDETDPYALVEAADIWMSDVYSALEVEIDFYE